MAVVPVEALPVPSGGVPKTLGGVPVVLGTEVGGVGGRPNELGGVPNVGLLSGGNALLGTVPGVAPTDAGAVGATPPAVCARQAVQITQRPAAITEAITFECSIANLLCGMSGLRQRCRKPRSAPASRGIESAASRTHLISSWNT
jgi:hypothetical protein